MEPITKRLKIIEEVSGEHTASGLFINIRFSQMILHIDVIHIEGHGINIYSGSGQHSHQWQHHTYRQKVMWTDGRINKNMMTHSYVDIDFCFDVAE